LARGEGKARQRGADMTGTTTLDTFVGVYGLPPAPTSVGSPDSELRDRQLRIFSRKLDHIERLLAPFNGLRGARIYYLPIDTHAIPGTGAIIIDDTCLALGFSVKRVHKVDFGLIIENEKDIIGQIGQWFEHHVLRAGYARPIQEIRDDFH